MTLFMMDHKNDLPLMSNTKDITVYHYVLDVTCDFDTHKLKGHITLFLLSRQNETSSQIFSIKEYVSKPDNPSTVKKLTDYSDHGDNLKNFELILDCCDLEISKVEEIVLNEEMCSRIKETTETNVPFNSDIYKECKKMEKRSIDYSVDKWCVKIAKEGIKSSQSFPSVVRITYNTIPKGASLRWVHDQENR